MLENAATGRNQEWMAIVRVVLTSLRTDLFIKASIRRWHDNKVHSLVWNWCSSVDMFALAYQLVIPVGEWPWLADSAQSATDTPSGQFNINNTVLYSAISSGYIQSTYRWNAVIYSGFAFCIPNWSHKGYVVDSGILGYYLSCSNCM